MGISRVADNINAGNVEITMQNLSTTIAATLARPIRQADIDANRNAVAIVANNQVGLCTTTRNIFGAAVAVSSELTAKGEPRFVTVQVKGVAPFFGTTTLPTIGSLAIVCHSGKVAAVTGTTAILTGAIGHYRNPSVVNVWDTDRIDVLL